MRKSYPEEVLINILDQGEIIIDELGKANKLLQSFSDNLRNLSIKSVRVETETCSKSCDEIDNCFWECCREEVASRRRSIS